MEKTMGSETKFWEVVGPIGIFRQDFTTEAEARFWAKKLNAPHAGNKALHWSRQFKARPVAQTAGAQ